MIIKTKKDIPASEITDPLIFKKRRQIIKATLATMAAPVEYFAGIGQQYTNRFGGICPKARFLLIL